MDLKNLIFLVLIGTSLSFVIAHPSDIRASTEIDKEELSWLNDLESQIFTDPEELSVFLSPKLIPDKSKTPESPKKVIGEKDYDASDLIEEPLVVTERPYLLGPDHVTSHDEVPSSDETEVKNNESHDESTTNASSDIYESDTTTTVSPTSEEPNKNDKSTLPSHDGDYLLISTSENAIEDTILFPSRNNGTATPNAYHVLDKILLEMHPISKPTNTDNMKKSLSSINENNAIQRSEVKSFFALITNQTWFIILGCILVCLFCGAFLFVIIRLRNNSNERSAITLISHNDYDNNQPVEHMGSE